MYDIKSKQNCLNLLNVREFRPSTFAFGEVKSISSPQNTETDNRYAFCC